VSTAPRSNAPRLTLPAPPLRYDPTHQTNVQRLLEQAFATAAQMGAAANFGDTSVTKLTVNGDAAVAGNFSVASLVLSTPTFKVNGFTLQTTAIIAVASTTAGVGTAAFFWKTPAGGGAGTPNWGAIAMADLPDYVELAVPDATVTTVANNAGANVALGSVLNLAANEPKLGDCYRCTARGVYGTALVAPNITLAVLSPTGVVCTTTAIATAAASLLNRGWEVVVDIVVTAVGAIPGRVEAQGVARLSSSTVAAQIVDMENTATQPFNTTIPQTLQLVVTWGTAAALNTISCRQSIWEKISSY
jgi:hypothetical protein